MTVAVLETWSVNLARYAFHFLRWVCELDKNTAFQFDQFRLITKFQFQILIMCNIGSMDDSLIRRFGFGPWTFRPLFWDTVFLRNSVSQLRVSEINEIKIESNFWKSVSRKNVDIWLIKSQFYFCRIYKPLSLTMRAM